VVFDIGNVLIRWDPDLLYAQLLPDPAARAALFETVDLDAMNARIDLGAPFAATIEAEAARHPHHRDLIRQWHLRWIEMFSPPITGSWEILEALRRARVPVLALSNFGIDSFEMARTHYPQLDHFDRCYVSGRLGMVKPDPRIYAHVEQDSGLSGPELFFVDDRPDNVDAARARGWQGHVFTGPEALAVSLRDADVIAL